MGHSGGRVVLAIHRCRKPTIAAMQGSAVGVGMTMTLPAVIR
jgi:enoyl-CoA hydratase/carnithine racemase